LREAVAVAKDRQPQLAMVVAEVAASPRQQQVQRQQQQAEEECLVEVLQLRPTLNRSSAEGSPCEPTLEQLQQQG
jgi:hypothetical protein